MYLSATTMITATSSKLELNVPEWLFCLLPSELVYFGGVVRVSSSPDVSLVFFVTNVGSGLRESSLTKDYGRHYGHEYNWIRIGI